MEKFKSTMMKAIKAFPIAIVMYIVIGLLSLLEKNGQIGLILTMMTLFVDDALFSLFKDRKPNDEEKVILNRVKALWSLLYISVTLSNKIVFGLLVDESNPSDPNIILAIILPFFILCILIVLTNFMIKKVVKNSEKTSS